MNMAGADETPVRSALAIAQSRFISDNPQSQARHERARQVLPAGHSRQTLYYAPFPLTIAYGDGARVVDIDGHSYVNMVGDYAAGLFGHTCQPIHDAVTKQLTKGLAWGWCIGAIMGIAIAFGAPQIVDKDSGIRNDPNDWSREHNDPQYILNLVQRVVRVSLETVRIVEGLPALNEFS
jgi:hypothetical protein